jgi:hypothetical protein
MVFLGELGKKTPCQPAWVVNKGCSLLVVDNLKLAGYTNVFEICSSIRVPFSLAPGDSQAVDVSFKPVDFKEFTDELWIYSDDRKESRAAVTLVGRVPLVEEVCIRPDSTKINFGKVYLNQEKTVAISVTNCSDPPALLKVEAGSLKLKDYTVAPNVVPNLTPGGRVFLNITFRPVLTGERVDTLYLEATSVFDSSKTDRKFIVLSGMGIDDEVYALPNAFTPNDDDKNDFAKIHFPGYKMVAPVLRIYDLRGIAVRVLRRPSEQGDVIAWDGYDNESRSRLMPPGAYIWLLEDQSKKVGSGVVVLIR